MTDKDMMRHLKRDAKKRRPTGDYDTVFDLVMIAVLFVALTGIIYLALAI